MVLSMSGLFIFYSNGHVFILPGNVLLVNQATTADYGAYTCTASNAHGTTHATSYGNQAVFDLVKYDFIAYVLY